MSEQFCEEHQDLTFFDSVVDSISLMRSVATALLLNAEDLEKKLTQLVQGKFPDGGLEEIPEDEGTVLTVVPNLEGDLY